MKHVIASSFLLFFAAACTNADKNITSSENDIDAARNFIQSALNSDYAKARLYMLPDSPNLERMNLIERIPLLPEERKGLAGASINIHQVNKVNDSTTIVIYSNSFKNNWDTLRVKKYNNQWLVDFNFLFTHDGDSLAAPPPLLNTDSTAK